MPGGRIDMVRTVRLTEANPLEYAMAHINLAILNIWKVDKASEDWFTKHGAEARKEAIRTTQPMQFPRGKEKKVEAAAKEESREGKRSETNRVAETSLAEERGEATEKGKTPGRKA